MLRDTRGFPQRVGASGVDARLGSARASTPTPSRQALPDLRYEPLGVYLDPDAPRSAGYWRCFATHTGPFDPPGLAPTGKRVEFEGADFYEFRDGKLIRERSVFDMADVMRQLGVLPPTGGRAERLTMRLANLRTRLGRRS